jgi:hypothetical protein
MDNCDHNHYYLFGDHPMCLHKLFERGLVQSISREITRDGVEFLIWTAKLHKNNKGRYAGKYKLLGTRSRLTDRQQIICAIELARKYNIQRVRL